MPDLEQLIQFRRILHQYPEVSGNEKNTAERVIQLLQKQKLDALLTQVGGNGIVATWDSGQEGPAILFRSELDALPIQEINTFDYQSTSPGVSHKCGHDGHTTILCGVAQYLSENRPVKGKVHLLFQPAEENGEGAVAMLADSRFQVIQPDYVFALHNLPGYPMGQVQLKEQTFTAAVNSILIRLEGKTAHAAEPEHGHNPAMALSKMIEQSLALANNQPEEPDMRVVTPVYMRLGELAYGISAGEGELHLTLRCWDDAQLRALEQSIEQMASSVAVAEQLKVTFSYTQSFHANQNHPEAVAILRKALLDKGLPFVERDYPFKWGEDFGAFTAKYKGCMLGLGSGENTPALHNPDYDFPDELISVGIDIFSGILTTILNQ